MNDLTTPPVEPEPAPPIDPPQPEPIAADPPLEPAPDPQPEPPKEHGNKGKSPWFLERIAQESARARAAEEAAADLRERLARVETNPTGNAPPVPAPQPRQGDPNFNAAVEAEAARRVLASEIAEVRTAGLRQFGSSFNQTADILGAVGAATPDFVADVIAADKSKAHVILADLAKDPELAATLVQMSTKQRIAELTRLSMAATTPPADPAPKPPAPKTVSRAPAPPPPVQANAKTVKDWRNADDDEEWNKGFDENQKARAAAGKRRR